MIVFATFSLGAAVVVVFSFGLAVAFAAWAVSGLPRQYRNPVLARLVLSAFAFGSLFQGVFTILGNQDNPNSRLEAALYLLLGVFMAAVLFLGGLWLTKVTPETILEHPRRPMSHQEAAMWAQIARLAGLGLVAMSLVPIPIGIWLAIQALHT